MPLDVCTAETKDEIGGKHLCSKVKEHAGMHVCECGYYWTATEFDKLLRPQGIRKTIFEGDV